MHRCYLFRRHRREERSVIGRNIVCPIAQRREDGECSRRGVLRDLQFGMFGVGSVQMAPLLFRYTYVYIWRES